MATYLELARITEHNEWGDFFDKTVTATQVKAAAIIDAGTSTTTQLDWARASMDRPRRAANSLVPYVIAVNHEATIEQILAASDNAIQTNIDAAVDALYP